MVLYSSYFRAATINKVVDYFHEYALAIIIYPTSASGIIVLLKTNQEILLDLAVFALQEQPEDTELNGRYS